MAGFYSINSIAGVFLFLKTNIRNDDEYQAQQTGYVLNDFRHHSFPHAEWQYNGNGNTLR
jgi:hypothetical protein